MKTVMVHSTNPIYREIMALRRRYAGRIAEYQMQLTTAKAGLQAHTAGCLEYEAEVAHTADRDFRIYQYDTSNP